MLNVWLMISPPSSALNKTMQNSAQNFQPLWMTAVIIGVSHFGFLCGTVGKKVTSQSCKLVFDAAWSQQPQDDIWSKCFTRLFCTHQINECWTHFVTLVTRMWCAVCGDKQTWSSVMGPGQRGWNFSSCHWGGSWFKGATYRGCQWWVSNLRYVDSTKTWGPSSGLDSLLGLPLLESCLPPQVSVMTPTYRSISYHCNLCS